MNDLDRRIPARHFLSRRSFLAAGGCLPLMAACGGGGGGGALQPPEQNPGGYRDRYVTLATSFTASSHSATLARDGAVILVGGSRGLSTLSDSIDRFDPAARSFTRIGALASGRAQHQATALGGGGVLLTGGLRSSGGSRIAEWVDDLTGRSEEAGLMNVSRVYHSSTLLKDGRVLLCGGSSTGENAPGGISASAEIWTPSTRAFRRVAAAMRMGRSAHTATLLPDGRVLLAGGFPPPGAPYQFAEIFDPATETFMPIASATEVKANHVAHATGSAVLFLGGDTVNRDGSIAIPSKTVWGYDIATASIAQKPDLLRARTWAAAASLPDGDVLLFGGMEEDSNYTPSAQRYRASGASVAIASLPNQRALHTATRLNDGRVLVAGGEAKGGAYQSQALVYE